MLMNSFKSDDPIFINLLVILLLLSISVALLSIYLAFVSSLLFYKIALAAIVGTALITSLYLVISGIFIIRVSKGKKTTLTARKLVYSSLSLLYPKILQISELLHIDKARVHRVFQELNNKLIVSQRMIVEPGEILVLLPHCLQNSKCPHKITGNIENCKRCGLCDINPLIVLQEKYQVDLFIATGGTIARKVIKDKKPKAIIAVACERDLGSGILDIKHIPVIGILNDRPEGPCVNTRVKISLIEDTIKYFIGQEE